MADSSGPGTVTTQYFHRASKIKIGVGNFSTVNGIQNNYYAIKTRNENIEDLPQLEEFHQVMKGSIRKKEDVCEPWLLSGNGKEITEAAVYTAEIVNFGTDKFTVKVYNGRKAKKAWRRDFLRCSNDWRREIPLFGYNKSSVPLLIFHGELVPIAEIEARAGWVERFYLDVLSRSFGCATNELWMDPIKGIFCRGPAGPKCLSWIDDHLGVSSIPMDIGFLEEDALIRYFSSTKDDWGLLFALDYSSYYRRIRGDIMANDQAQIISSLTNSTIAFVRNVEWFSCDGCLAREKALPSGMRRYLLRDDRRFVEILSSSPSLPWLLQSLSVFHALDVQLDEDLSVYKLIRPYFRLTATLKKSKRKRQRRRYSLPIFLFLLPSPSPVQFYYWSHDLAGGIPLSRDSCKYLGLPFKLSIEVYKYTHYWSTKAYKTLRDYQISKRFDPKSMDFARLLGYNSCFEIVPPESRFQEVEEDNDTSTGLELQSSLALNNVSRCPEAESSMMPEFLDGKCSEQSDDVYSLDELFREIKIGESARIKFPSLINWPYAHRGTKPSIFTATAENRDLKQCSQEEWSDVD